jgi:hypothetical protein
MNFAELRFWQLLLLGLTIIFALRLIVFRLRKHWAARIRQRRTSFLGLFLLASVSLVTFVIFLAVAISSNNPATLPGID